MKTIYKEKVLPQIKHAISMAQALEREIDYIEISDAEHKRLRKELGIPAFKELKYPVMRTVLGVQIKVIDEHVDVTV